MRTLKVLLFFFVVTLTGCAASTAPLALIAQGRQSMAMSASELQRLHTDLVKQYEAQSAALDAGFDADVRACAEGKILKADGTPVPFTAEWVIAERQGLSAAKTVVAKNIANETEAQAARLDNIQAGLEALGMAEKLLIMRDDVSENVKPLLMELQERRVEEATNGS